jgi:hypothetical protein
LTLRSPAGGLLDDPSPHSDGEGGLAVATEPPKASLRATLSEGAILAARRRHLVIRHASGDDAVALLEIVSPGNKSGRAALNQFVDKAAAALDEGLHLQVIDLFPPGRLDPAGMHGAIWLELGGIYEPPPGRPLALAAYVAAPAVTCYVEPSAVGMLLAELPLFLAAERYVNIPLEETYAAAYRKLPRRWADVIEGSG